MLFDIISVWRLLLGSKSVFSKVVRWFVSLLLAIGVFASNLSFAESPRNVERPQIEGPQIEGPQIGSQLSTRAPHVSVEPEAHQVPELPSSVVSFDTTEGTFMNVDVSPDGETLIFDLLGDVYQLPLAGGDAVALTSGRAWDQAPRFSPDGASIYFVSDREGHKNIWRLVLADQSMRQVTRSNSDIQGGPNWSQDGSYLLAGVADAESRHTEYLLQAIDPITGDMAPIDAPNGPWIDWETFESFRPRIRILSAVESADRTIYLSEFRLKENSVSSGTVQLFAYDLNTQTRTTITPIGAAYSEYKPLLSHDGNLLAYFRQYNHRRTEIRILNRLTGQDSLLIELADVDDAYYGAAGDTRPNYAFTPDDRELVFWNSGKIHRVQLADGSKNIIPFRLKVERETSVRVKPAIKQLLENGVASTIRWPSFSRSGQTMAFAAIGYVWIMDLQTGAIRRLTESADFEYMPAISPNGKSVAFISFTQSESGNDYGSGRLVLADTDGEAYREVLADPNETYLLPKWSPDGSMIALIREVKGEYAIQPGVGGTEAAFGWTLAMQGAFHEVAPAPGSHDPSGWFSYARFVSFDDTGNRLLFSFQRSRKETVLATARLDGSSLKTLAIGTSEVGGVTPASDLKNLALTRRDGTVWVIPFAVDEEQSTVSTLAANAQRVSHGGGYYVDWTSTDRITFGFGKNVYRHTLDHSEIDSLRVTLDFAKSVSVKPIAFSGARLVTISDDEGAGPVIESGTIVLEGQRIVAVGPADEVSIPEHALLVDATGKTIMPGLLDTHYHRIGGPGLSALRLPSTDLADQSAITYGITSAWEPGGPTDDGVPATVDLQSAGRIAGPRWSHSAQGTVGYPFDLLTSYAAATAAVEQHRELGVDVLKEAHTPTRQQRQWLVAAAHTRSLGIVSHLDSFDGTMTRIIDGYTGGEHPYIPTPFFKDVQELLRQTGYIWTPNIVITTGVIGTGGDIASYYCHELASKRPEQRCDRSETPPTVPYANHRVRRVAELVGLAERTGASIGLSGHAMTGLGLHMEMWYLWKGGVPVEDVLRAATITNAQKLGLQEEIGSLEPGKIADFLVLDDNPLDDILNTLAIEYTVQGGVVYDSDTAMLADLNSMLEPHAAAGSSE